MCEWDRELLRRSRRKRDRLRQHFTNASKKIRKMRNEHRREVADLKAKLAHLEFSYQALAEQRNQLANLLAAERAKAQGEER